MPGVDKMCDTLFTPTQWLTYYKNYWTNVLLARTVDVQMDSMAKAKDPDDLVQDDDNQPYSPKAPLPVKMRLEKRKMKVESCLELLAAIDALAALSPEDLAKMWTPEFLAVAKDVQAPEGYVSYIVAPGKTITDDQGQSITGEEGSGSEVMLDPTDPQVQGWIADGSISATNTADVEKEAAPAAPTLVSFTVQPDMTFVNVAADGISTTMTAGQTVDLDPNADATKAAVTNGIIAATTANV